MVVHTGSIETQSFSRTGLWAFQGVEGGKVGMLDDGSSALGAWELVPTTEEDMMDGRRGVDRSIKFQGFLVVQDGIRVKWREW